MSELFTLEPDAVSIARAEDRGAILGLLAGQFADVYRLDRHQVLDALEERERLGSTGFGRGVAIPHARVAHLRSPVAAFIRLDAPVAFAAADGMPVNLVYGLLSPEHCGAAHLQALAAISRMMRDEGMRVSLAAASDREAIYGLLSNVLDRYAA
jgi:PTS system nitrogen regulatory IIA component